MYTGANHPYAHSPHIPLVRMNFYLDHFSRPWENVSPTSTILISSCLSLNDIFLMCPLKLHSLSLSPSPHPYLPLSLLIPHISPPYSPLSLSLISPPYLPTYLSPLLSLSEWLIGLKLSEQFIKNKNSPHSRGLIRFITHKIPTNTFRIFFI